MATLGISAPESAGVRTPFFAAPRRSRSYEARRSERRQHHNRTHHPDNEPLRSAASAVDPVFDDFFGNFLQPRSRTVQSLGSGVIFDAAGHVLTNEHVIARADRVRVSIADGREFDAELVGADPNNDIAVLRILTDEPLPFTPPGTSSDLMVGEPVIAIGNPFGFSNSVTTGVISAQDRSVNAADHTFHGLLQTDASINPGNSGGPLLNAEGSS